MAFSTLIDAASAHGHLGDPGWAFIDCRFDIRNKTRGRQDYEASHITGAVFADLDQDLSGPIIHGRTGRHPLPRPESIVQVFSAWGIGPQTQVVAYDESTGAMAAARLWWLLKWAGHDDVAVLDGGFMAWTAAGFPCRPGTESRPPARFAAAFRPELAVDARDVLSVMGDPGWVILDARAADRYRGENETIDPVAGHISGAVSAPSAAALGPGGLFKPAAELARLYQAAMRGRDAEHTIVYCGSGVTAAHIVLSCRYAGLGMPRLYPGSWSEWIIDKGRPTAKQEEQMPMEFRIEKRGEIQITGMPIRASTRNGANLEQIPAFWDECHSKGYVEALMHARPADSRLGVMGVCVNDFDPKAQTFTYLIGIERPSSDEARKSLPGGCVEVSAPAGTWAVFGSRGPLPGAIQGLWKRIYSEWFPTSGYKHFESPDLEVYEAGDTQAADYYCEVWLPVVKA